MKTVGGAWQRLAELFRQAFFSDVDSESRTTLVQTWHDIVLEDAQRQASRNLIVLDGAHRLVGLHDVAHWSLSRRVAERTFDALKRVLATVEESAGSLLVAVRLTLHEAYAGVRCIFCNEIPSNAIPSTRDWTHSFFIHTGFSPPLNRNVSGTLVQGGKIESGRRSHPAKDYNRLRRNEDTAIGNCRGVLESEPPVGGPKLVRNWANHISRKAICEPFRSPSRLSLGNHI
jgi:hypothetical protein